MKHQAARRGLPGSWRSRGIDLARTLGSLRLAVVLLPSFAAVLFLGTVVESRHGRPAAALLVYQTWWFIGLLGLLGLNIFFAAAKKWPWQRHQIGFIITHVGLLTLITGGFADSLFGTTGAMNLVSSSDLRLAEFGPNRCGRITDRTAHRLQVRRPRRSNADVLDHSFNPGPLAWDAEGRDVNG